MHSLPHINRLHERVRWLSSVTLHGYIVIPQSPHFTLEVTLGVTHSMGLGKCTLAFAYHSSLV